MLKAMIKLNHNIDISKHSNVIAYLKSRSKGYTSVKSKVFEADEVSRFLKEAPDKIYLSVKVGLCTICSNAFINDSYNRLAFTHYFHVNNRCWC